MARKGPVSAHGECRVVWGLQWGRVSARKAGMASSPQRGGEGQRARASSLAGSTTSGRAGVFRALAVSAPSSALTGVPSSAIATWDFHSVPTLREMAGSLALLESQSLIILSPSPPCQGFQNTEIEIQVLAGERKRLPSVESSLEKVTMPFVLLVSGWRCVLHPSLLNPLSIHSLLVAFPGLSRKEHHWGRREEGAEQRGGPIHRGDDAGHFFPPLNSLCKSYNEQARPFCNPYCR